MSWDRDLIADIEVKSAIWNRDKIALILYINYIYIYIKAKAIPVVLEQMDLLLSTITQDHGIFTAQVNSDSASSPLVSGIYNLLGFVGFFLGGGVHL